MMSAAKSSSFVPAYRIVSAAFLPPREGARRGVLEEWEAARAAAQELGATLADRIDRLGWVFGAITEGELKDEHRRVFAGAALAGCPPFETGWGGARGAKQSQQLAEIAGFYRTWGVREASRGDRIDHIAAELDFAAVLAGKESAAAATGEPENASLAREARRRFLDVHLGRWAPFFVGRLRKLAGYGPYLAAARALGSLVSEDLRALGISTPRAVLTPRPGASIGEPA